MTMRWIRRGLPGLVVLLATCRAADHAGPEPTSYGCGLQQAGLGADTSSPPTVPLKLVACVLDAEVGPGDPVPIFVALQNTGFSGAHALVRLELDQMLGATVFGPDGKELVPISPLPDSDLADVTFFPNGGVFGRVVDLRCYHSDTAGGPLTACSPLFDFSEQGTYWVVFYADGVWCPSADCNPTSGHIFSLKSDPVELRVVRSD